MSFDYARARAASERLIARFGKPAVLEQPGASSGPAWAPVPSDPMRYAVKVVELNERVRDRSGALIGETMTTLMLSTAGLPVLWDGSMVEPTKQDRILLAPGDELVIASGVPFAGTGHGIAEVRPLQPGGVALLWEVDLVR